MNRRPLSGMDVSTPADLGHLLTRWAYETMSIKCFLTDRLTIGIDAHCASGSSVGGYSVARQSTVSKNISPKDGQIIPA